MSFIRNFMTWNAGTEVSENYFFWSGISALAACVNGQIWIRQGKFIHYPNMYIVLLGPAGNGKTVAIDRAEEIIRAVGDITLSGQSETSEGLLRFMRDKCVRTFTLNGETIPYTPISLYLSELSNFFGKDPAGMIDMITGIWDRGGRQYFRRTKGQGEDLLERPNVNLLGGTTPAWITQYLKADIVGGGFTRRVVFVNEPRRDASKRVAWPEDTQDGLDAKRRCVEYAAVIRSLVGEVHYTPDAKAEYISWYENRPPPKSEEEEGYHASKPGIMLKVASLVAISREPKLEISKEDVETALALLEVSEKNRQRVFQSIGRNELNTLAQRLLDKLSIVTPQPFKINGEVKLVRAIPEKVIRGEFFRDGVGSEYDEIIKHLLLTDKIDRRGIPGQNGTAERSFIILKE